MAVNYLAQNVAASQKHFSVGKCRLFHAAACEIERPQKSEKQVDGQYCHLARWQLQNSRPLESSFKTGPNQITSDDPVPDGERDTGQPKWSQSEPISMKTV